MPAKLKKYKIIKINQSKLDKPYAPEIFSMAGASFESLFSHKEIAKKLKKVKIIPAQK